MLGAKKPRKLNKTNMKSKGNPGSSKGLPRLNAATTFKELSDIISIRSNRYPTNYMDLLLLENEHNQLSGILALWEKYPEKNDDFKDVPWIKAHIRHRENHHGWIFDHSGNEDDPIVRLIGLKGTL
jgi:hypothetical protein